jgi:hypothetical protein
MKNKIKRGKSKHLEDLLRRSEKVREELKKLKRKISEDD